MLHEFEAFVALQRIWPENIADDLYEKVRSQFEGFADQMYFETEHDPDEARDEAHRLASLGETLGVDVSETVNNLESHAQELEDEADATANESDWSSGIDESVDCLDEEIVSMFKTLQT